MCDSSEKTIEVGDKFTLECTVVDVRPHNISVRLDGDQTKNSFDIHMARADAFKNIVKAPKPIRVGQVWRRLISSRDYTVVFADEKSVVTESDVGRGLWRPRQFRDEMAYVRG